MASDDPMLAQSELPLWLIALRWIAVFPGALVAGYLGGVFYILSSSRALGFENPFQHWWAGGSRAICFVCAAWWIAPHPGFGKAITALIAGGFVCAYAGAVLILLYLVSQQPDYQGPFWLVIAECAGMIASATICGGVLFSHSTEGQRLSD